MGKELKALRSKAKLTQAELAPYASVVAAHVSAWENGKRGMSEDQASKLDRALNANGQLLRAWERNQASGTIPPWYKKVPKLEQQSTELREYQSQIFPGLIQTPEYARTTIQHTAPWATTDEVEEMVLARKKRQEILERDHPPLVSVVVEAFVLDLIMGDETTQIAQLDWVLQLVGEGKIRFQVTPPRTLYHPGAAGPFRIYTFPDNPPLASAEYASGEVLIDDQETVQKCMTIFGLLQAEALPMGASVEFVRKVRESIEEQARARRAPVAQEQLQRGARQLRGGGRRAERSGP
ncbi:helix-turn-helix transcriptional regulator [Nocardiopsis sp. N85]|uniref:helix-turn-helix domain-containing protein n=1 Tax=Nocardiopsis sp. N85 TaxID=3029400 RepID=UPI00237F8375|nr:helix-turn-helix transcriptional regulator [Nocardiopsis sp. N85]MDE3725118.1 helix-turn-helix transcriptional regulator [Nocardiopsis sp. N85]